MTVCQSLAFATQCYIETPDLPESWDGSPLVLFTTAISRGRSCLWTTADRTQTQLQIEMLEVLGELE